MDLACIAVGVNAPTLKHWLALGEAAYLESEEEDLHCRFFEAVIKALEYADQARDLNDRATNEPEPQALPRPRSEQRRAGRNRPADHPPLVWLVVEEAPIEIVIGSRPPWVYETPRQTRTDREPEPPRSVRGDGESSQDTLPEPVEIKEIARHRDSTIGLDLAVIAVGLAILAIQVVVVLLVLLMIPVVSAGYALMGAIRGMVRLAYRWRAGLIALRGRGVDICPPPSGWAERWTPPSGLLRSYGLQSLGAIALTGRMLPQRE